MGPIAISREKSEPYHVMRQEWFVGLSREYKSKTSCFKSMSFKSIAYEWISFEYTSHDEDRCGMSPRREAAAKAICAQILPNSQPCG
jgi:hypothetical protein